MPPPDLLTLAAEAPVGLVIWTADGDILLANGAFCTLIGQPGGPSAGYWAISAEGQKQRELSDLLSNPPRPYDKEFISREGRLVSVSCRGWPLAGCDPLTFAAIVQPFHDGFVTSPAALHRTTNQQLRRQNKLLLDLARSEVIDRGELGPALAQICSVAAEGMGVERASVWLYDQDKTRIVCLDLFEKTPGQHSSGATLHASDFPGYFVALAEDRAILADDAHQHPATREFSAPYLAPLGINSMLDAPVRLEGKLVGVLCHEHIGPRRSWTPEEQSFAASLAEVVARALEASERHKAEQALHRANEELEARVEQRTSELKEAHDALWGEMQLAHRIQTALLPEEPALPGFSLFASSTPAAQVGGDYLDVLPDQGWLLIGDVSGHGVPAGLVMMMCQTAVRAALAANPSFDPAALLVAVNGVLAANIEKLGEDRYMSISALRHRGDGLFDYAGLHLELLIFRAATGSVETLFSRGMWLAMIPDVSGGMENASLRLDPGDVLLLYTDGLVEAERGGQMLGLDGVRGLLEAHGAGSVEQIGAWIFDKIRDYETRDDVTFLVVRRNGGPR